MRALLVILVCTTTGCWFLDGELKVRNTTVPEELGDGWEIGTPEEVGLDPAELAAMHEELLREDRFVASLSALVIKNNKLVWETYLRDPAVRDRVNHIQSSTKSVTSLAWGAALDRGLVPELDATLCSVIDCAGVEQARAEDVTFEQLFTMRSGVGITNDEFSMEMWVNGEPKSALWLLNLPFFFAPGAEFEYRDADPQLVTYALEAATGKRERDLVDEWYFRPLGITDVFWDRGRSGETMGAHGLHLRPRDLAKLGQLVLDGGRWKGEQLVSQAWIERSTRAHTESDGEFDYGYYWWITDEGFSAWGHGGQFVFVVPAHNLVLVQTALPDGSLHGDNLRDWIDVTRPLFEDLP